MEVVPEMSRRDGEAQPRPAARLALVTCGPQVEAALECQRLAVPSLVRLAGGRPRSSLLLAAVDLLIENAGLEPPAIEEVVVSRGPGSFTGIRAGLASASGFAAAVGCTFKAYDSLLMLAARCDGPAVVWSAQPGRRGEVYVRRFEIDAAGRPSPSGEIRISAVDDLDEEGPWVAVEALELGRVRRAEAVRSSAEALLRLSGSNVAASPPEPLYVEGPPIHGAGDER